MRFRTGFIICVWAVVLGLGGQMHAQQQTTAGTSGAELSDREKDGLSGPVRRITVESAKIILKNGIATEAPRVLREVTTYDPRGKKTDTVAYPIDGDNFPGKEQYKYDDKGNIVEMELRSQDGRLLSKELYKYQMDEVGNWKKMTTSLAVFLDGNVSEEPLEVTYRTISYFYSQEIAKLVAAKPATASSPTAPNLTESRATQPAGRQRTGLPALEAPAPSKNDPKFTNSRGADRAISQPDESNTTGARPSVPTAEPVAMSQKVSSTPLTAPMSTTETSPSIATQGLPAEEREGPNDSPSGVTVSNTESADARAANPARSDPNSLYKLGVSNLEAGKPAEAIVALKAAVHKDPENALAYMKLGLAYFALHQYKEAIAVYHMAIQIRRDVVDAEAYFQLGQAYGTIGKYSEAVDALTQAIYITREDTINSQGQNVHSVPSAQELHYTLGLVYHRLTKYKEAIQELQIVIAINPRLAEAHFGLAVCYLALGDRKSAEKQQKVLAPLNPALAQRIAEALSGHQIMPPGVNDGMLGSKRMN